MSEKIDITDYKADIAVIGGGAAGLSVAAGAAMLGVKVVLYEAGEMGGDCLNYGCVPSKALLSIAKKHHALKNMEKYGLDVRHGDVNWTRARQYIRQVIDTIAPIDSQERFEGLGVTVIREHAKFADRKTLVSKTTRTRAKRIVIATGSTALVPPIPGLQDIPYLTNESIFDIEVLPEHLIILGGGPIGIEMAQAFNRLGSKVTVIEMASALARTDRDHVRQLLDQLCAEGVNIKEGFCAEMVRDDNGQIVVTAKETSQSSGDKNPSLIEISGSHLLVALGRRSVIDAIDPKAGGLELEQGRPCLKANLRSSSNPHIWVLGDAAGAEQFTHIAGWHASVFVRNALFKARVKADALPFPMVIYTDPEIAQLGMSEAEARVAYGDKVKVSGWPLHENDRAQAEGDIVGEVKLITKRDGKILGVSAFGSGSGDIIQLVSVAMSNGLKVRALTNFISPYPTRSEVMKRAASKWYEDLVFGKKARILIRILKHIP